MNNWKKLKCEIYKDTLQTNKRSLFISSFSICMTVSLPAIQLLKVSRNFLNCSFRRYSNNAMGKRQICPYLSCFFRSNLLDWLAENIQCLPKGKNKKSDLLTVMKFIPKIWTCCNLIFFRRNVIKVLFLLNFYETLKHYCWLYMVFWKISLRVCN